MVAMEVSTLRSFGQRVEFEATRSIELLKAIDNVIYACGVLKETNDTIAKEAHNFLNALKRADGPVDPDGSVVRKLETARDALGASYKGLEAQFAPARSSATLSEEDGVVDAFDQVLEAMADTHNVLNELCWAVGEQTAEFDKPLEGEFETADDLFKAMGV